MQMSAFMGSRVLAGSWYVRAGRSRYHEVGEVFGLTHTYIIRARAGFQRYDSPVRRHGGG